MKMWKRNLIVCWFGMFVTGVGLSQIAPILPLYINKLGVSDPALVSKFSGIAFGVTFISLAIFSPIWGQAADRVGRKPMLLRASLGMTIIISCMGFAPNVYALIGLRLLQGIISGYSTACTTLIATQTEKEHAGYALGTLSTANIAGSLLGPTLGGFIEESFGLQNVFFLTGGLLFIAFITTALFVKESFTRSDKKVQSMKEVWDTIPYKNLTITLFVTFFILTVALYSVEPIITVYVSQLSINSKHVSMLAGITFSASGLANILAAPKLGKLSDKIGTHKIILTALILAGIIFIPQAFVKSTWQLMFLRFLLGLTAAGLTPSINILIKKITPSNLIGRVFGFTMSAAYLGTFAGSILGGQIAGTLGIRYVFFVTSALLLINAVWVYFNVYKKLNSNYQFHDKNNQTKLGTINKQFQH
ncbi:MULTISPECIES: multidrug efflux MFS transporter [Clostridium]|uniref:Arabinose efflux permease n=1 Tax=Clostridium saccharoperbutylacetonicum N1-4(HMT) TaxID=931276 RepID=M1LT44_9CLOT|nr:MULTISPECIES: multidrug efflux MFS transporter [Clostridium]AGF56190.1 arabinose efflux permease [Clostridium saccharoperbutylacetonicum N1-4(HMT)]AQR94926.1 tetracycline resistance protein, class B [Clostridium saccharoperbutylacetonicum]NRT63068.1 MFS family permease [Clostridium saccharoperbutylacetonicum]NSB26425.1 MFS family permease [Clostridium saccharoperbutylacetonicum]NSB30769.1 MFS family permease [Clostridium saccharoperbutylacetonicum]